MKSELRSIVILDKITDVRNFGAILRTAESAGANAVVFPSQGAAMLNSGTVKSSAGAIFNISICRSDNLKDTIDFLKNSGLKIVAATEKGAELFTDADLAGPLALIMGSISWVLLMRIEKAKIPLRYLVSLLR